jgi:nucleotide-binding universal stress UspA family protein
MTPRDPKVASRLLVVLDDRSADQHSLDSAVIRRAAGRARRDGSAMLLLQICYESSLNHSAFASRREIESARNAVIDAETEKTLALQERLAEELEIPIDHEVTWSRDRCAAIVNAALSWEADIVFKQRGERSYTLGLFSNTDWDLLRESSVPIWFVAPSSGHVPEDGVVAAVDAVGDEPDSDQHFMLDDAVFEHAKRASDLYAAPLHVVHAYQLPRGIAGFQGYAPVFPVGTLGGTPVASTSALEAADREARDALARRHGEAIQMFVDRHGIPLDDIEVLEGPTPDVIRSVATRKGAGLVVMGAADKGRWERLIGHVSAEPSLADAPCDVLIVPVGRGR